MRNLLLQSLAIPKVNFTRIFTVPGALKTEKNFCIHPLEKNNMHLAIAGYNRSSRQRSFRSHSKYMCKVVELSTAVFAVAMAVDLLSTALQRYSSLVFDQGIDFKINLRSKVSLSSTIK